MCTCADGAALFPSVIIETHVVFVAPLVYISCSSCWHAFIHATIVAVYTCENSTRRITDIGSRSKPHSHKGVGHTCPAFEIPYQYYYWFCYLFCIGHISFRIFLNNKQKQRFLKGGGGGGVQFSKGSCGVTQVSMFWLSVMPAFPPPIQLPW